MKEFIRDNLVFNGRGSKFEPDNQKVALVEFWPPSETYDNGACNRLILDREEAERLQSFLGVWLRELD